MRVTFRTGKCGTIVGFRGSRSLRHHRKGESERTNSHWVGPGLQANQDNSELKDELGKKRKVDLSPPLFFRTYKVRILSLVPPSPMHTLWQY